MNFFGVGPTEIFLILIVLLILFGPEQLPEIAKKIGGATREMRESLDTLNEQMNQALETSMEMDAARMLAPTDTTVPTGQLPPPASPSDGEEANQAADAKVEAVERVPENADERPSDSTPA